MTKNTSWELGKYVKKVRPRFYLVESDGRVFRRNRKFPRLTNEVDAATVGLAYGSDIAVNNENDIRCSSFHSLQQ